MGKAKLDHAGKRFGHLVAIEDVGTCVRGRRWRCRCDCGTEHIVTSTDLVSGNTVSCGCWHKSGKQRVTHGHSGQKPTRAYIAWLNMKQRCTNKNLPQFKDWGGRGIAYDPRWEDFENFLVDMGEPPKGMSLDRRDNDGNYCKENCRWVPIEVQRRNSRKIEMIEWKGETMCARDWDAKFGLPKGTILQRIRRGMPLERAMCASRMHRFRPNQSANSG